MIFSLTLPDSPLAATTLAMVASVESVPTANHSVRSFLFGTLLAEQRGLSAGQDFDPQLLFLSCVLHDVGLSEAGNRSQRFEVDGADLAAEFLTAQGLSAAGVDVVWEAIALHTSAGIAERRGAVADLTRCGVGMDFGRGVDFVSDDQAAAIHTAYPRHAMAVALADEIVSQALARPEKAPRNSLAAELVRERGDGPSTMEMGAAASRWGS